MQRPRQHPMPHRQHHLDHPGHTRRRGCVTDLDFTDPNHNGLSHSAFVTVNLKQCLRLYRITETRTRAVRLDRIDLRSREPSLVNACWITRC